MPKTFVFSNLATSIDGKIATASRKHFFLGTPADRKQMQVLRKKCDVVVMGASTLRSWKRPAAVLKSKKKIANAIVSSELEGLSTSWPFFHSDKISRIFIAIPENIESKEFLARAKKLSRYGEVWVIPRSKKTSTAHAIVDLLSTQGMGNILVEGGGDLMWSFISENLIDEINVTITPKIVGGKTAPTLVEGLGFLPEQVLSYKIKSFKKIKDELYLVYKKSR